MANTTQEAGISITCPLCQSLVPRPSRWLCRAPRVNGSRLSRSVPCAVFVSRSLGARRAAPAFPTPACLGSFPRLVSCHRKTPCAASQTIHVALRVKRAAIKKRLDDVLPLCQRRFGTTGAYPSRQHQAASNPQARRVTAGLFCIRFCALSANARRLFLLDRLDTAWPSRPLRTETASAT